MKILVIGPSPTRSKGGMATVISEIRDDRKLSEKYDIDVFASYIDGRKLKKACFTVFAFLKFCLTKRNYDIYHIHAASRTSTFRKGFYVRAAKKWGKKVIFHVHGAQYMEFYREISDRKKSKVIRILKAADLVIALSQDWKNKFDETFGLTNCVVLENGIDTERLAPAITSPEAHQNSFVALGRLGNRKGTYDLVGAVELAVKSNPNIKLYLAGDGEVEQVRQLVQQKKLTKNIEVVGWADFEKKLELLQHVSTVVLPSYNEGLPMSILEGMACGKAIISTKVGAIPEVVKPDNGILIDAGDVEALASAMVRCTTDLKMISLMGRNNIEVMRNEFSMVSMHKKLMKYYDVVSCCIPDNDNKADFIYEYINMESKSK